MASRSLGIHVGRCTLQGQVPVVFDPVGVLTGFEAKQVRDQNPLVVRVGGLNPQNCCLAADIADNFGKNEIGVDGIENFFINAVISAD